MKSHALYVCSVAFLFFFIFWGLILNTNHEFGRQFYLYFILKVSVHSLIESVLGLGEVGLLIFSTKP